jgi:hypothetical protein
MRLSAIFEQTTTIISGHKHTNTHDQNRKGTGALIKDVRSMGMTFKMRSGNWRGHKETAIIIKGLTCYQAVNLMKKHDQEAVVFNGRLLHAKDYPH